MCSKHDPFLIDSYTEKWQWPDSHTMNVPPPVHIFKGLKLVRMRGAAQLMISLS